jgi:hypothetical protein
VRYFFFFISTLFFVLNGYTQANLVFSGGEVVNFSIVDISAMGSHAWRSERASQPGYFSSIVDASYIGYSDQANIDGYIKKYGDNAFVFPVGTGNDLRTLEISKPYKVTDAYATAWIEGDPSSSLDPTTPGLGKHSIFSLSSPIVAVSKVGQWDWQVGENENLGIGTTGSGEGLIVTVSIPDMTQFSDASELRLVGWNGSSWMDLSGKSTATGNKENSKLSGVMIPGISSIAIGKVSTSSTVKLLSFNASSLNCNTLLKWETSSENNSSSFILEQSSDDIHFHTITTIPIKGSIKGNIYSKEIIQPIGISYYRLKIMHANGTFEYSLSDSMNNKCNEIEYMKVYPNPVVKNENINLRFTTSYNGIAQLMIFRNNGQKIFSKDVQVKPGTNNLKVEIKNLINGTYFINLLGSRGEKIGMGTQFVKQ